MQIPAELLPFLTTISRGRQMENISANIATSAKGPALALPKIRAATFSKVLEWATMHKDDPTVLETIAPPATAAGQDRLKVRLGKVEAADKDDYTADENSDANFSAGENSSHSSDSDSSDVEHGSFTQNQLSRDTLICPADRKFLDSLDIPALIDLTAAANYLAMEPLLDSCCKAIAEHMGGLSGGVENQI